LVLRKSHPSDSVHEQISLVDAHGATHESLRLREHASNGSYYIAGWGKVLRSLLDLILLLLTSSVASLFTPPPCAPGHGNRR
jgi:hypothetical protein